METLVPFQSQLEHTIQCGVCPHNCRIRPGKTGICRVRVNRGQLVADNYAEVTSYSLDPVEKKPLYHFWPGSTLLSIGSTGCNFRCGYCQNWTISQRHAPTVAITPAEAVDMALAERIRRRCVGIAFTYSEPLMWYEYVVDTAELARERGLKTVLVTNGYINERPRAILLSRIDALNIDLKSIEPEFYRRQCGAKLDPVLDTITAAHEAGCHVELTNLLIPGLNDGHDRIERLVRWVAGISPDIPLHFSRYFPNHRFEIEPTPPETVLGACDLARHYLNHVYAGNVGNLGCDTHCQQCGEQLIERKNYRIRFTGLTLRDGQADVYECVRCGKQCVIAGKIPPGH